MATTNSKIITINVESAPTDEYPSAVLVLYTVQVGSWGTYSFEIHYQNEADRYVFSDDIPVDVALDNQFQQYYMYAGNHNEYSIYGAPLAHHQLFRAKDIRKNHWDDYDFGDETRPDFGDDGF